MERSINTKDNSDYTGEGGGLTGSDDFNNLRLVVSEVYQEHSCSKQSAALEKVLGCSCRLGIITK